jgi:REP element-mobilizing transposase RayT
MRARRQIEFPGFNAKAGIAHGGSGVKGRRKTFRPIDPKQALHVVLKSSKARGGLSLLHPKHCNAIELFMRKTAKRWGIRVYRYANVGNHIHLLIQVPTREAWKRFSKELSGGIAQIVTGARKGLALKRSADTTIPESAKRAFWDELLFTRIVKFGRDFEGLCRYVVKNIFEAAGVPMKRLLAQGQRVLLITQDGKLLGAPS